MMRDVSSWIALSILIFCIGFSAWMSVRENVDREEKSIACFEKCEKEKKTGEYYPYSERCICFSCGESSSKVEKE